MLIKVPEIIGFNNIFKKEVEPYLLAARCVPGWSKCRRGRACGRSWWPTPLTWPAPDGTQLETGRSETLTWHDTRLSHINTHTITHTLVIHTGLCLLEVWEREMEAAGFLAQRSRIWRYAASVILLTGIESRMHEITAYNTDSLIHVTCSMLPEAGQIIATLPQLQHFCTGL